MIAAEEYLIVNGVLSVVFVSICLQYQAFYEIFKHSVDEWSEQQRSKQRNTNRNDEQFICDLIRFHVRVSE